MNTFTQTEKPSSSLDGESQGLERKDRIRVYGKHYKALRAQLWYAQGIQCFYRFPGCTNRNEAIAHKDHDSRNWEPSNLAASCRHCNASISNQARGKKRSVKDNREKKNGGSDPTATDPWIVRRSRELAKPLKDECDRLIHEAGTALTWRELEIRLAKICGCSQQKVTKFLEEETCKEGEYATSDRTVSDGRMKRTLQFVSFKLNLDEAVELAMLKLDRSRFLKSLGQS